MNLNKFCKPALSGVFVILFLISFRQASAHATPITYNPEAASLLEQMPEKVSIKFSERIEPKASGIIVYGPDGSRADLGEAKVDAFNARLYQVAVKNGGQGTYAVSWQVVSSDDGHFTKGGFAFSVGKKTGGGAPVGQIQIQHITTIPQAATIGIELVGQALILGVLFFLALLWRPLKKKFSEEVLELKEKIEKRFTVLMVMGGLLVLLGTVLFIVIKTFDLQQLRPGDFADTLKIFIGTVDGSYALARTFLGLLTLVSFLVLRKSIFRADRITKAELGILVLILATILIRARVSHAAASAFYPTFSIFITALQLFFKELWVGGLVVMAAVTPLLLRLKNTLPFSCLSTAFSKAAIIAFGGVGITGVYVVWMDLKDPSYLFSTEWGARLIILSMFGAALLAVRLYHQLLLGKFGRLLPWSPFTLKLEMLIGLALLSITSLIIITTPPYRAERFRFERSAISQGAQIKMSVHPYETSKLLIVVQDSNKHSELLLTDIVVTLANEEKSIGPIVAETEQRFLGGYVLPKALLSPFGEWKINVSARRPDSYDATALFTFNNPEDIESSRISPDQRSFGGFEAVCLVTAMLILAMAVMLYRFSKRLSLVSSKFVDVESKMWIFPAPVAWVGSLVGLLIISGGILYSYNAFFKNDFQKLCETNGHFWLQSVPVKDGHALSQDTVTGCFLDVGLYHFADKREYSFFFKKREVLSEVMYSPAVPVAGELTEMTITLNEVKDGRKIGPITELGIYHDRIIHVMIAGEDMQTYAHIHSEDAAPVTNEANKQAVFPFKHIFPKAGRYALNIDYLVSGIEYTNVVWLKVAGDTVMEQPVYSSLAKTENQVQTKEFDGYRVTFTPPKKIKTGEKVRFGYYIEKDGRPVTDLGPYLGAAMHFGLVRNDLGRFLHAHGEALQPGSVWFQQLLGKYYKYHMHFAPDSFGPKIITPPWTTKFTNPGVYTVFGEFMHKGKVILTVFNVEAD